MDKLELVKQLRSGDISSLEQIKKILSEDLIKINEEFIHVFEDSNSKVTRNFWRKKAKPFNEADLSLIGWKNFTAFKEEILGKDEDNIIRREDMDIVKYSNSKNKTYFVTSAIIGERINIEFLDSIKTFAKDRKAEIVILPMKSLNRDSEWSNDEYELLSPYLATEYSFNPNLIAYDFMLNCQMTVPLTGISRFGQKQYSIIVASPKQQLVSVPVSVSKLPHLLMSTGSISVVDYKKNRIGRISDQDHVIGGIIVEVKGELFHTRQVQANKDNSFRDLNKLYSQSVEVLEDSEAIVLGDWHNGFTDPNARKASFEQIKLYKPKVVFLHDFVDSYSISHHLEKDIISKSRRVDTKFATLEKELKLAVSELETLVKTFPNVQFKIVSSNHSPDHILRYLKEGRWIEDTLNTKFSIDLFRDAIDDKDPVEEYIFRMNPSLRASVEFLKRDQDVYVEGILCSAHGDKGSNGSKGSVNSKELSYGSSVTGHSHTPSILRNTWVVGTNSLLSMDYTLGSPSSWLHANCVIFKQGRRQMLISVDGKWRG